ncbi:malate/lactate/ureidoglycolate dehydrogenase [Xanthobacter sp. ZOL 2024]
MTSTPQAADQRVGAQALERLVQRLFERLGSVPWEARLVAGHVVRANLLGHDSHGVGTVPGYVTAIRGGLVRLNRRVSVVSDFGSLLSLDGHGGLGQSIAAQAMDLAITRARQNGACILSVRNSHHMGRIGTYAEQCAAAGLVSIHFVNVVHVPPVVAPHGGRDARTHTNPLTIGMPRPGTLPLVLDFATSRAAYGKMRVARNRGTAAAPGYLLDASGNPTLDPEVLFSEPMGALLPFGDHKGAGLGLMCDLLAGALSGGGTMHHGTFEPRGPLSNNMLSIVLDPERLAGAHGWCDAVSAATAFYRASPPADPDAPVLLPGEQEERTRQLRQEAGIPIDANSWSSVIEAALAAGLSAAEVEAALEVTAAPTGRKVDLAQGHRR